MTVEYSQQILEKRENINYMKTRPVGAELFHAGQTDGQKDRHDEDTSRFS